MFAPSLVFLRPESFLPVHPEQIKITSQAEQLQITLARALRFALNPSSSPFILSPLVKTGLSKEERVQDMPIERASSAQDMLVEGVERCSGDALRQAQDMLAENQGRTGPKIAA